MRNCVAFILKCTRACNFACSYCSDRQDQSGALGLEVPALLLKQASALYRSVDFIYHGGEPLVLGIEYFSKILVMQKLLNSGNTRFRNLLQTNGSLIDASWCDFFKANNVHVGVSLDGPQAVHDAQRRRSDGGPTFDSVARGVSELASAGVEKYGLLAVATEEALHEEPAALYEFFRSQLHPESVADGDYREVSVMLERPASPPGWRSLGEAHGFLARRRRYAELLCGLYRCWLGRDDVKVRIRELGNKLDCLVGGRSGICIEGGCCIGRYFGVDTSGEVAHCDTFFHDSRFRFGNIRTKPLSEMLRSRRFRDAAALEGELRRRCRPCPWFSHCRGGCLYEALLLHDSGLRDRQAYCPSKPVYDFLAADLAGRLDTKVSS
jgi:uncharacterized protein